MSLPRAAWAGIAAAALAAAAGAVLLGHTQSAPSAAPAAPLSVRASFAPAAVQFADPVSARIVVLLDRERVDQDSLQVVAGLAPLTALGPTRVTRTRRGRLQVVSYETRAACLSEGCSAAAGPRPVTPASVRASANGPRGVVRAEGDWPVLRVGGRVGPADVASDPPPFRVDTTPPPTDYRIAPSTLARLLDLLAAASALAGAALAVRAAAWLRSRHAGAAPDRPLARALRLAREAEARPHPDRRRAVGLLARLLDERDRRLAGAASDLAWSRPEPERNAVSSLADEVEREVQP